MQELVEGRRSRHDEADSNDQLNNADFSEAQEDSPILHLPSETDLSGATDPAGASPDQPEAPADTSSSASAVKLHTTLLNPDGISAEGSAVGQAGEPSSAHTPSGLADEAGASTSDSKPEVLTDAATTSEASSFLQRLCRMCSSSCDTAFAGNLPPKICSVSIPFQVSLLLKAAQVDYPSAAVAASSHLKTVQLKQNKTQYQGVQNSSRQGKRLQTSSNDQQQVRFCTLLLADTSCRHQ